MRVRVAVHADHDQLLLDAPGEDPLAVRDVVRRLGVEPGRPRIEGVAVAGSQASLLLERDRASDGGLWWSDAARRYAQNRMTAQRLHPSLMKRVAWARDAGRAEGLAGLTDLDDPEVLDDHQVANVAVMTAPECYGLCLFDEQGVGKTVTVIYAWDVLAHRDELDRMLIVAPKSMASEWARDLKRFRPDLYSVAVLDGDRRTKQRAVRGGGDVLVTGFETAVSLEETLRAFVSARRTLLVVDESFHVKNPDARRSAAVRRLREHCERAFVLCGTPAPNAPGDLRGQVDLADFGIAFNGVKVPDDREAAVPVVRSVVHERAVYLRSLKRDVLPGLPAKRFTVVGVELAPRQAQIYDALRDDLVEELRGTSDGEFARRRATYIARRSALLQTCSNPAGLLEDYDEEPAKLAALRRLVADLVQRDEKVVVWSFFRASLARLAEELGEFGAVRYDGSLTDVGDRREAVRRFQEDPETRVFIGNPAAAGAGLTLHAARYAVYESFSGQAAHYLQSLDRVHRRGQDRQVELVVLLCRDTIEHAEYERLRAKEAAAHELLGDAVDTPVTRSSMLDELLMGRGR